MEVFPGGASICVILAIVIAIWVHRGEKRTEALQAVASSLIFSFLKKADKSFVNMNSLDQFHLFSRGHSRKVLNVMTGRSKDNRGHDHGLLVYHGWRQAFEKMGSDDNIISMQSVATAILRCTAREYFS